jgi:hypothetical protein
MLREMRLEIGPIPGICASNFTIVDDLLARLKSKLTQRGLQVNTMNYTSISRASTILEKRVQFFRKNKMDLFR